MLPAEGTRETVSQDSGLTQNEQSEAVEQGTDVGQDPHQHSKLGRDKHDKSEKGCRMFFSLLPCQTNRSEFTL